MKRNRKTLWWLLLLALSACVPFRELDWGSVTTPYDGPPSAMGGYASGCLSGGEALPREGEGFQVMRASRLRYFGHPDLVDFVKNLAVKVANEKHGILLIGDMAQPRGGRIRGGHSSHQTGLDADILFLHLDEARGQRLNLDETESVPAPSLVNREGTEVDRQRWESYYRDVLKLAAADAKVNRIFVHPAIKKELCRTDKGAAWLTKIRPWWGHDDHFHVRLNCPKGDALCGDQGHPPPGDGCDASLAWWFSEEAARQDTRNKMREYIKAASPRPRECEAVFRG